MIQRRVVVTGVGAVTPLGNTVAEFWQRLCAGENSVGAISLFDPSGLRTRIAAEVRDFAPPAQLTARDRRACDRCTLFALSAAMEAWADCCLSTREIDRFEVGVLMSSSHGGESSMLAEVDGARKQPRARVSPWLIPRTLNNMAAAQIAIQLELRGPSFGINAACASGAHAIGEAAEIIRRGDATAMLCGGADACITPLTLAGDDASGALSRRNDDPEHASRPFDTARDGFVVGEGAGALVLEEREHALSRGAHVYGELVGYGATTDAVHPTRPDATGNALARAIERAADKAGVATEQVDAVFAHATGTPLGDRAEAAALSQALGDHSSNVAISGVKGSLGHLMGAAGAVQAIAALRTLSTGTLPPTRNLEEIDPTCHISLSNRTMEIANPRYVLSNSVGFGGHNVALLLAGPEVARGGSD